MEVHIYSVKDNSQAGNMSQRYTTQKGQSRKKSAGDLKKIMHFARKFSRGLKVSRGYIHIYENTPEKLPQLPPKSCHNII